MENRRENGMQTTVDGGSSVGIHKDVRDIIPLTLPIMEKSNEPKETKRERGTGL